MNGMNRTNRLNRAVFTAMAVFLMVAGMPVHGQVAVPEDLPTVRHAISVDEDSHGMGFNLFGDDLETLHYEVVGIAAGTDIANARASQVGARVSGDYGTLLAMDSHGAYLYTPSDAAQGLAADVRETDSFVFVTHDEGRSGEAYLTVTVVGANDRPVVNVSPDEAEWKISAGKLDVNVLGSGKESDFSDDEGEFVVWPSEADWEVSDDGTLIVQLSGLFDDPDGDELVYQVFASDKISQFAAYWQHDDGREEWTSGFEWISAKGTALEFSPWERHSSLNFDVSVTDGSELNYRASVSFSVNFIAEPDVAPASENSEGENSPVPEERPPGHYVRDDGNGYAACISSRTFRAGTPGQIRDLPDIITWRGSEIFIGLESYFSAPWSKMDFEFIGLPDWLRYGGPRFRQLGGKVPESWPLGETRVTVVAVVAIEKAPYGGQILNIKKDCARDTFILHVQEWTGDANEFPVAKAEIPDVRAYPGVSFVMRVPEDAFWQPPSESERGDQISYTAAARDGNGEWFTGAFGIGRLPPWLALDYGVFTGTPRDSHVGEVRVTLTARDSFCPRSDTECAVSQEFSIFVMAPELALEDVAESAGDPSQQYALKMGGLPNGNASATAPRWVMDIPYLSINRDSCVAVTLVTRAASLDIWEAALSAQNELLAPSCRVADSGVVSMYDRGHLMVRGIRDGVDAREACMDMEFSHQGKSEFRLVAAAARNCHDNY